MAVNFDVVASLGHIDPIKHVEEALSLKRDGESVIYHVEENVRCPFVVCSDCKVVNLSLEDNTLAGDDSRI